jgi:murein DD-endopeptidase MepM/ murein hydrolase activator NlpD
VQTGQPSPGRGDGLVRRLAVGHGRGRALPRTLADAAIAAAIGLTAALANPAPADANLRLASDNASPRQLFWGSGDQMRYRFEVAGQEERQVRVVAVHRRTGDVVKRWRRDVEPGGRYSVTWKGFSKGRPAPAGRYFFRVQDLENGARASRQRSDGTRGSALRHHRFPVSGPVDWGDGWGAGRNHRGQDLFTPCGRPVLAARAGRVTWKRFQAGGAGYYVVIRGARNDRDYVYMHLQKRRPVRVGDRVETGQRIGFVGATGNASGCHLHFELWRGRWYDGGRPLPSVTRNLRRWNRWS